MKIDDTSAICVRDTEREREGQEGKREEKRGLEKVRDWERDVEGEKDV